MRSVYLPPDHYDQIFSAHGTIMIFFCRDAARHRRTAAMLMIGSGSLNGIAAQLSLPSMSTSRVSRRRRSPGGARLSGTRDCLVDNSL